MSDLFRPAVRHLVASLFALALLVGPAPARDEKPKEDKRVTATYDVQDLLLQPGGKTGFDSVDDVVRALVTMLDPKDFRPDALAGSTLHEVNGTRLEITTTPRCHAEIKTALEALRRINDMAVVLECDCFEVDRKFYAREIEPLLPKAAQKPGLRQAVEVEDALIELLRKKAADLKSTRQRVANNKEAALFSSRRAFTFTQKPGEQGHGIGFQGLSVRARVTITPDRREVRLKLTQQRTELLGLIPQRGFNPANNQEVTLEIPNLANQTTTSTLQVGDGGTFLMPLSYQTPAAKAKDRVLLLLVRPTIYIAEEEKERGNNDS
jgi:hypothetical protein